MNELLIYYVACNDDACSLSDKIYYNFITLDIEDLFTNDFDYYPEYDLMVLADREGYLHFITYNETLGDYALSKSYYVPQTSDTLIQLKFYYEETEEFKNYPTAIHILPNENFEDRVLMTTMFGDVYILKFDGTDLLIEGHFEMFSQAQLDVMGPRRQYFYSHSVAYSPSNKLLAINYIYEDNEAGTDT